MAVMSKYQVNLEALRHAAERAVERSRANVGDEQTFAGNAEALRLVEELRIYQSELETQNHELSSAQAEITSTLEKYRALFDNLPLPALIANSKGFVLEANRQAGRFLGLDRSEGLLHRSLLQLFDSDSRSQIHPVLADRTNPAPQTIEHLGLQPGAGPRIPCDVHVIHLSDAAERHGRTLLVLVDRTTEVALRESEERYSALFMDAKAAMLMIDPHSGRIIEANPAAQRFYGYTPKQLRDMRVSDIDVLTPEEIRAEMQLAKEERRDHFFFAHRLANGETRQVQVYSGPFRHGGKAVLYSIIHDVTQRKQAEQALRLESEKNLALLRNASDGTHIVDNAGNLIDFSDSFCAMLGYDREEMLGMNVGRWDARFDEQELAELVRQQHAVQVRAQFETRHRRKDGSIVDVEISGSPLELEGKPVMFYSSRDISERVIVEEQQRQAASVFSHAHDGILICDANKRIVDVNPAFTHVTGYDRDEALGQTPRIMNSGRQTPSFYQAVWSSVNARGFWEGEIWNRRKNGEVYPAWLTISTIADASGAISRYIGVFSDITAVKAQQEKLERLAHFDALTQLPNRVLLADRIAQAIAHASRSRSLVGICYLDLDGFKPVNDNFGHSAGDQVLVEIAGRLKDTIRGSDSVARLGGDEFVVLVTGIASALECQQAVGRLLKAISAPIQVKDQTITLGASIGVTLYPKDGADADTLLRHADQAMYAAKQAGRNRYHMFDILHDERTRAQLEVIEEIRRGFVADEFVLHFQPKVDMRRGQVLGFEALVRWQHPQRGLLLPGDFLPVIDNTDLQLSLGRWVIAEGLRQLDVWNGAGLNLGLKLGINISAPHLLMNGFAEELADLLCRFSRIEGHDIELEIIESVALEDLEKASAVFGRCRELGVQIALDDFGTGYSSLSYLRRLPVDTLKIDQSFVSAMLDNEEDMVIVKSVVGLSKSFRRNVVAEGIETPEIGALLIQMGCDVGQGFGIARPMPAAAVPDWLSYFQPDPAWANGSMTSAIEDVPLLSAEIEHTRWLVQLELWLETELDEASGIGLPIMDSRACKVGRWYRGEGRKRYGQYEGFPKLGLLHEQTHRLGNELVTLRLEGRSAEARQRIAEVTEKNDELIKQLRILQTEIDVETSPSV
jgi:diguanylate cyclase (GGDEF)-like protein/PAS domain S-box-containing protein